jgi:hypothetical protein
LFAALTAVAIAGCGGIDDARASRADVDRVVNGPLIVTEEPQ